uniref:Putative ovule protein n=1 Tax=Solanum chacoense TaxID=4108 RepID=A0A0V0GQZ3_SOLCH
MDFRRFCTASNVVPETAPGPDGFTMDFILNCWEIMKQDITVHLEIFMNRRYLKRALMQRL